MNFKQRISSLFKDKKTWALVAFIAAFLIAFIVFNFLPNEKYLSRRYYSLREIKISRSATLACSSIAEANIFAPDLSGRDRRVSARISKKPGTAFSMKIDTEEETLSFLTDAAVRSGTAEPDKYGIVQYVPGVSLVAVGYSGQTLVTVMLNLEDGSVIIAKAMSFLGGMGSTWFGTCY